MTIFAYACSHIRNKDILLAIAQLGPDINIKDNAGRTAFHHAAIAGNLEALSIFFDPGAAIDKDMLSNALETPIMFAVRNGNYDIVKIMLEQGCDPFVTNILGQNILDIARNIQPRLVELIETFFQGWCQ